VTRARDAVTSHPGPPRPVLRAGRAVLFGLLYAAVAVQLVVLYAPSPPSVSPFPGSDKVVHVLVFLVPVAVALLVGLTPRLVVLLFSAHAVVSEVVQALLLTGRSGDPLDVVADLAGVALGVVVWRVVVRSLGGRAAGVAGG
jgi:VanZ family protein